MHYYRIILQTEQQYEHSYYIDLYVYIYIYIYFSLFINTCIVDSYVDSRKYLISFLRTCLENVIRFASKIQYVKENIYSAIILAYCIINPENIKPIVLSLNINKDNVYLSPHFPS